MVAKIHVFQGDVIPELTAELKKMTSLATDLKLKLGELRNKKQKLEEERDGQVRG